MAPLPVNRTSMEYLYLYEIYSKVDRPLFWSAAQRTTEMIADQRTGKNGGPALADY